MEKLTSNRFGEMLTFVKVVELGGFSQAAKYFEKSPSAISKLITRLETRLNTRLFRRSTRGLQITEEGNIFFERSSRVLLDLDEAEQSVLANQEPTGHLRVTTNLAVGHCFLLPIIPEFTQAFPHISLDVHLTDKVVDLMTENTDIAIRSGDLKSSTLRARKLGEARKIIVASPDYLRNYGTPKLPRDLKHHNMLRFNFPRTQCDWPFLQASKKITIKTHGNIEVSDGESMRQLAISGVGLARLTSFLVTKDIAAGRLIPVLENYNFGDVEPVHVVFLGQGSFMPARIRAFIDFVVSKINVA